MPVYARNAMSWDESCAMRPVMRNLASADHCGWNFIGKIQFWYWKPPDMIRKVRRSKLKDKAGVNTPLSFIALHKSIVLSKIGNTKPQTSIGFPILNTFHFAHWNRLTYKLLSRAASIVLFLNWKKAPNSNSVPPPSHRQTHLITSSVRSAYTEICRLESNPKRNLIM